MWHKNKSIALYLLHSERPPLTALTPRCTDAWLQVIKKKDLSLTKSPPNAKLFNCLSARITHGKKLHKKSSEAKQISTCSRVLAEWRAVEWSEGAQRLFLCGEALIVQLCLRVLGVWMSLKHPPPSPPHPPSLSQLFYRKHSAAINMQHQTANQTLVSREGENWRVWRERERRDGKTQRARTVQ